MSRIHQGISKFKEAARTPSTATPPAVSPAAARRRKLRQSPPKYDLTAGHRAVLDNGHLENNRVIFEGSSQETVTPFKILRTRMLQLMDRKDWRILAVTAPHEGAGKTITAINLAITIAQSGDRNVFLLDLDLRKPGVARSLGLNDIPTGIGEFLSGKAPASDILWEFGNNHLVVVPGSGRFDHSSELLTSGRLSELIGTIEVDKREPIIIVDLPPVLVTDDALAIAPMVDCVLMVVAEGQTKRADVLYSIELLEDVNLAGVVLNKSRDRQPGY